MKTKTYKKIKGNKRGGLLELPMVLMMGFVAIVFLIAFMPAIISMINIGQQSNSLNCPGYTQAPSPSLNYNSSLPTSTIGCTILVVTPGIIVLGVIMGVLTAILYGRTSGGQQEQQGY